MASAGPGIADIDFDDLTSPKLTEVQRQVLQFTEAKHIEFDIEQMLAEAIDQAGVGDDLDDADGFGDRLVDVRRLRHGCARYRGHGCYRRLELRGPLSRYRFEQRRDQRTQFG